MKIKLGNAVFEVSSSEDIKLFSEYVKEESSGIRTVTVPSPSAQVVFSTAVKHPVVNVSAQIKNKPGVKRTRGKFFTLDEDKYLIENYGKMAYRQMGVVLNRPQSSVQSRVETLIRDKKVKELTLSGERYSFKRIGSDVTQAVAKKVKHRKKKYVFFTPVEDEIIKNMVVQKKNLVQIAKSLKRKNASVLFRIKHLGLSQLAEKNKAEYEAQQLKNNGVTGNEYHLPQVEQRENKKEKVVLSFDSIKDKQDLQKPLVDIVTACAHNKSTLTITDITKILGITAGEAQAVLIDVFNNQVNIYNSINKTGRIKWKVDRVVFE
jgi:hypothetical protein